MPEEWHCEDCLEKLVNKRTTRSSGRVNYFEH